MNGLAGRRVRVVSMDEQGPSHPNLLGALEAAFSGRLTGVPDDMVERARDEAVALGLTYVRQLLNVEARRRNAVADGDVDADTWRVGIPALVPQGDVGLLRTMDMLLEGGLWRISDADALALRDEARRLGLRYTNTLLTVELIQRRAYAQGLHPGGDKAATPASRPLTTGTVFADPLRCLMYALGLSRAENLSGLDDVDLPVMRSRLLALLSGVDREMMHRGLLPERPDVAGMMLLNEGLA